MGVLGINPWIGLVIVVVIVACIGVFLERIVFRPFLEDFNRQVMIGVALISILTTTVNVTVGGQSLVLPKLITGTLEAGAY